MPPIPRLPSLLFLARGEGAVRTELAALRRLGTAPIAVLGSLHLLLAHLADPSKPQPDLILCDEHAGDTSLGYALAALYLERGTRPPMLVFPSRPKTVAHLQAAGIPMLERPYTLEALCEALLAASQSKGTSCPALLPQPKPAVRSLRKPMSVADMHVEAMKLLQRGEVDAAAHKFELALARTPGYVPALLGLAKTCRMRNDPKGMERALLRAYTSALRAGDTAMAENVAANLPQRLLQGNVFSHEAISYLEEGNPTEAARSLLEAARHQQKTQGHRDPQLFNGLVAQACQFTPSPQESLEMLCTGLERLGRNAIAQAVRARLLHGVPTVEYAPPARWLDNYPRLRDFVDVARYTAAVWRSA